MSTALVRHAAASTGAPPWARDLRFQRSRARRDVPRTGAGTSASDFPAVLSDPWYQALTVIGVVSGVYHGYKRNDSIGWAIGWGLLGGLFPYFTIPISIAQGYGKPAR